MSRTLQQVMSELGSTYDPIVNNLRAKQALIPQGIADEEKGLKAQEQDYYDNTIMSGARGRGLGFSGIPLGERARYGATQFLPALARLRQSGREGALSLEEAILNTQAQKAQLGQGIYENERNFFENQRQFNINHQLQQQQLAAQKAAAAAAARASSFSPTFGGGAVASAQTPKAVPKTNPYEQEAFNDVYTRLQNMPQGAPNPSNLAAYNAILSDYKATQASANYGNQKDKIKIQLYHQLAPQLFTGNISASALGNGGQLRF